MIKFFRQIRKHLLMDQHTTQSKASHTMRYFKYAAGEIVLVVIGILIALQINNWNEKRKQNNLLQTYYKQLLSDFEDQKNYSEDILKRLDSSIAS